MCLWDQSVTLYILHAISVLYIEKVPAPVPPRPERASDSNWTILRQRWLWRLRTTYRLWGNPQLLRVQSSVYDEKSPQESQKRTQDLFTFIFLRAVKIPLYYYVHKCLLPTLFRETIEVIRPGDVGTEQQKLLCRLGEFTGREAVVRAYTATLWIWESLVFLDGANSILALVFVLAGIDQPEDWPPLFGSLGDATTLRKFWGAFWHKLAVRPYKNYGRLLAGLSGIQPTSVYFKVIVALVVFGLSGITHAIVTWHNGLNDWYLEIGWFILNFCGCLVETVFLSTIRTLGFQMGWSRQLREIEQSWFGSFLGYTWVFAFFFWSVPQLQYPRMELQAVYMERVSMFNSRLATFRAQDYS